MDMFNIAQTLVQKGILTKDDLAGGATLNPQQREELADLTIDATGLKEHAEIEKIYDRWEVDTIELSGRYGELDNGTKSAGRKPATAKVPLEPVPLKAVLPLHDGYLRRLATKPIPEEQKARALGALLGTALANDAERSIYNSSKLGHSMVEADYLNNGNGHATNRVKDVTMAQFDGLFAAADAVGSKILSYNASGSSDYLLIMRAMFKKLPAAYRAKKDELRYYVPADFHENLLSYIQNRKTNLGDLTLTEGDVIKFNGIIVAPLPLLEMNPFVTEHITMNGTTAKTLKYTPISASTFYAQTSTLSNNAEAPGVAATDYVLSAATVALPASGSKYGNTDVLKFTYQTQCQIFLTKKTNFIIGIGVNDMSMESQRFANEGVTEFVARTRIGFAFVKDAWVVRGYNIADTIIASS